MILPVFVLIGLLAVGTSIAYFTDGGNIDIAKFVTGTVQIEFRNEPKVDAVNEYVDNQQVRWTIKNTGNNDAFLRVSIDEIDADDLNFDGEIKLESCGIDWIQGKDEYYYYRNTVKPGEDVDFCLEVTFEVWDTVDRYPVNIEVEAVQASNDAISQVWPKNPFW